MTIYLVWDLENDEVISIHQSYLKAREALVDHLRNDSHYTTEDWEDFADNLGFEDVEEFQMELLETDDYDVDMNMCVEDRTLEP